jgi:hypothetical protein
MTAHEGDTDAGGSAIGAAEDHGARDRASGHVQHLCGRVDDMVNGLSHVSAEATSICLHREVERHELDDGLESSQSSSDTNALQVRGLLRFKQRIQPQ